MKYRKKPIVIEAYQTDKPLGIETLEGTMHASPGDYGDTGEEDYRASVKAFKAKWLKNPERTYKSIIDNEIENTRKDLYRALGLEELEKKEDADDRSSN